MSNYTKITDFAAKDALLHGNPSKVVTGTGLGAEFDAIATAVATKVDVNGALGTPSSGVATNLTGIAAGLTAGNATNATNATNASQLGGVAASGYARSGANSDITSLNAPAIGAATATTQSPGDNTTKVATTAFVTAAIPAASTTVSGIVELATSAEAIAGSDAARAITPATLFGGLNASGSAPIYACRAWVNFNGTGTVAIRASGNVSSITDNGTGNYTVNFTTAMPDANFAANVSINNASGGSALVQPYVVTPTVSSNVQIITLQDNGGNPADTAATLVIVFR